MAEKTRGLLIDRVYALLHALEEEQHRRSYTHEPDEWLDGVRTGTQAAKRQQIQRLRWVLDPATDSLLMPDNYSGGACDGQRPADPDGQP